LFFSGRTGKPLKQFQQDLLKVKNGDIYVNSEIEGWKEIYEIKDVFNDIMVKIQELLNNIRVKEKEKHEIELDFLQAQINPHFLYNTLFSIKCMVEMKENKQASLMLADFIELLRMTLKKEGKFIQLSREMECIKKYVSIQKYRYENKFELYYETPQECSDILVPKLILQPIVENAIFHGIEPKETKGMIVISTRKIGNNIEISVSDDGVGMNKEQKEKYRSISFQKEFIIEAENYDEMKRYIMNVLEHWGSYDNLTVSSYIIQALDYVEKNYFTNCSLEKVALYVGLNQEYFSRLFKKNMKQTFSAFLTGYRIEIAKKLLYRNNYSISDIAEKVGYQNLAYFSTVFKKATGQTPFDYRK